jgi:GNAT superfamily N-acetyltransferase/RimJ/RimL family protein N-acetyltransferase
MVTLRPATTADLPFLEHLRRITMKPVVENHRPWIEAEQLKRALVHFDCAQIIRVDGREIGLWKVVRGPDEIHLCQIQLEPSHQRSGIGTQLIGQLQSEADARGVPIFLHVYRSNPAVALYRRLGFRIAAEDAESQQMAYRPRPRPAVTFPVQLRLPLRNYLTGRPYELVRADNVDPTQETLTQITGICREPKVYNWLFREMFGGRPYTETDASAFVTWTHAGWANGSHFVFFARDETQKIGAACDIKAAGPVAEIGYWAGARHRGIMTNAVQAMAGLAAQAGFRGLFARTALGNKDSNGVLLRSGFIRAADRPNGDAHFELWFHPPAV